MKRSILICCVSLSVAAGTFAQENEAGVVLSDAVMKQVVGRVVNYYFKPRRSATTIYFSEEGIKEEWMPRIRNIRFVLVKNEGYGTGRKGYMIRSLEREGGHYTIGFGFGDLSCGGTASGETWTITVAGDRVRLWNSGGNWAGSCSEDGG